MGKFLTKQKEHYFIIKDYFLFYLKPRVVVNRMTSRREELHDIICIQKYSSIVNFGSRDFVMWNACIFG